MTSRRASGPPERVGSLVPAVLRDLGLDESARALRIQEGWQSAVGSEVAAHAQPVALRNGALEVQVDSSAWCQTLRLRAPQLLDGLARALGDDAPRALWFRLAAPDGILRRMSDRPDAVGQERFRCDFCGSEVPRVRRVALDRDYDRLQKPHRVQYACPECSERKERERSARGGRS